MNQYVVPVAVLGVSLCGIAWALLSLRKFEWALSGLPRPDEQCRQDLKTVGLLVGWVLKYLLYACFWAAAVIIFFCFYGFWVVPVLVFVTLLLLLLLSPL